jgi:maleylacetate reductase
LWLVGSLFFFAFPCPSSPPPPHDPASVDEVTAPIGSSVVGRFSGVAMHVPVDVARTASALARETEADGLVAVGGGSSIGTAKAIALETGLPILALPTTYAGSEMTPIWGLTRDGRKTTGRDPGVLPRTVIYDPELTLSLPADLSAASGMNALAHLVEALYAPSVSPLLALTAEEGVRALAGSLPAVVADPSDLGARADALYGAWLAGSVLGATRMGVHHTICHVLGGRWSLPHAATHSAVLGYATSYNAEAAPEAMERLVGALAAAGRSADSAASGVWELARDLGAPTSLAPLGWSGESVPEAARLVVAADPVNPRVVDLAGVTGLLEAALAGERPGRPGLPSRSGDGSVGPTVIS